MPISRETFATPADVPRHLPFTRVGLAALCLVLATSAPADAYFQDAASGVRPAGMGDAFVSVADDGNAPLFNPAGVARVPGVEITGMYSDLYSNLGARLYTGQRDRLGYNYVSLILPASESVGSFGISWTHFYSTFYKENTFVLTYARQLVAGHGLDFGVSLKALQWMVEANDYTTDPTVYPYRDREKLGYTADVGLLTRPFPGFSLGAGVENAVPVNMALAGEHRVPAVYRAGLAFKHTWTGSALDSLEAVLEWNERDTATNFKFGLESWLFDRVVGLRAGANLDALSSGASFRFQFPTAPVALQLDYAFTYPFEILDSFGSHRFGLTLRWGGEQAEAEAAPPAEKPQADKDTIEEYYQEAIQALLLNDLQTSLKWWEKILAVDPENETARRYAEEIRGALAQGTTPDLGVTASAPQASMTTFRRQSSLSPEPQRIEVGLTDVRSLVQDRGPEFQDNVAVLSQVAERLERQGDLTGALENWELVRDLDPQNSRAGRRIGELTRRLASQVEQPWQRGLAAFEAKQYSRALKEFRLVLKLDPNHGLAQNLMAKTREILGGRLQKQYAEGVQHYQRKEYAAALRAFRAVTAVDPDYQRTRWYLEQIQSRQAELQETAVRLRRAEAFLRQARLNDALDILAPIMRSGQYDRPTQELFSQVTWQKAEALQHYHSSLTYFNQKQMGRAIDQAQRSLALDRQSQAREVLVESYIQQGVLHYRQKRYQAALAAWERALPLDPDHAMLGKYLQRVRNKLDYYRQQFGEPYVDPR